MSSPTVFNIDMLSPQELQTYIPDTTSTAFNSAKTIYQCYQKSASSAGKDIQPGDACIDAVRQFCTNTSSNPFKADIFNSSFCACEQSACAYITSAKCMQAQQNYEAYLDSYIISEGSISECSGNECINEIIINGYDDSLSNIIQTCNMNGQNMTMIFKIVYIYRITILLYILAFIMFILLVRLYNTWRKIRANK